MTRLRFGVNLSTSAARDHDPVAEALLAEELGFDFVSSSDHPCGEHPANETWTLLSWVAASTRRIAVMTRVLGAPFRPPVLVAKMSETLHRLSDGRLILGLGAGAQDHEMAALAGRVLPPGARVAALEEAATVIRGVWGSPHFTYDGQYYELDDVTIAPRPRARPPIWIGAFGPRALEVTGRVADGWIPTLGYAPAADLPRMRDRVLSAAEEAGRSPEALTCALNLETHVGSTGATSDEAVAGRAIEVVSRLRAFATAGFDAFNFIVREPDTVDQYRRLANEVVMPLREEFAQ